MNSSRLTSRSLADACALGGVVGHLETTVLGKSTECGPAAKAVAEGVRKGRSREPDLAWQPLADDFGEAYLLHLTVDPSAEQKLHAVALHPEDHRPAIVASRDGGSTWVMFAEAAD